MKISRTRIAHIIADHTLQGASTKKLSQEVAAYLLSEGRVGDLDSIMRDVQADRVDEGYVEVVASSAFPLSAKVKADIQKRMKSLYPNAQDILVTEVRDPELIGGVRLSLANQQLDLSIEAQLNKFKQLTTAGKE